jgi:hypothetical protein
MIYWRRVLTAAAAMATLAMVGCGSDGGPVATPPTLSGVVIDGTGNRLSGVRIVVGQQQALSNTQGAFAITSGLALGPVTVAGTLTGYQIDPELVTLANGPNNVVLRARRTSQAPTVTVSALPATLTFIGGQTTITVTADDPEFDPLTVSGSSERGTLAFTAIGYGLYQATLDLPGNAATTARVYPVSVVVSDGINRIQQSANVTVSGVGTPSGIDNGTTPGGGGPPIPNIR